MIGEEIVGIDGSGTLPSIPTRKRPAPGLLDATPALQPPPGDPEALQAGKATLIVCPNPTPSIGITTVSIVDSRSNIRDQPPRITVSLLPNILPRKPSPKLGFHAAETRGETLPQSVEKTG